MTSDHPHLSRRGFLGTAALGGAAAAGLAWPIVVPAQPSGGSGGTATQGTRVRRNIYALAQTADGRATIEAGMKGDVPLLTAIALLTALIVSSANRVADRIYPVLDPRMRGAT